MTEKQNQSANLYWVVALIGIAALRLVPQLPNFSPFGAICLIGGAYGASSFHKWGVPLLIIWFSDLLINNTLYASYFGEFTWFYSGFYWQYGSYIFTILIAHIVLKHISFGRVLGTALAASVVFFIVSNFGVWASGSMYPSNFAGLTACYVAAIPFFKGTLLGNLAYTVGFFGLFQITRSRLIEQTV